MIAKKFALIALGSCALAGCASNYGGEGALAGGAGGALLGAAVGGNPATGAILGAAAGAAIGSTIHKDGHCYRRDRDGNTYEVHC